jgi:YVTN family beta-propeller protein
VKDPIEAVSTIDPRTNRVASTTAVGRYPDRIVASPDAVFVINEQDETISRIDPHTRAAVHTFGTGSIPTDLVAFADAVWVATPLASRVLELDGSTDEVSARIPTPEPLFVASGKGTLWVAGDKLLTVEPRTGKTSVAFDPHLRDPAPLAQGTPGEMVVLGPRVFFDAAGAAVSRISPATHTAKTSQRLQRFRDDSRMIAVNGSLWLTSAHGNDLMRIDPKTLELTMNVAVGSRPVGVAFGAGSLWVANSGDGTVMRIEPATGRILATIRVGGTPFDMTFAHGLAWITFL